MVQSLTSEYASSGQCVCIIQARRGSERLRDKVIMPLAGKPALQRVIERALRIEGLTQVVVAIPDTAENDMLEDIITQSGAMVARGPEQDVLTRFAIAYDLAPAPYVMRVTADCPLLDPTICAGLLQAVIKGNYGYGATARWPHGLDCEVTRAELLLQAHREAVHPLDREHVTLWIKRQQIPRTSFQADQNYMQSHRWVLDYPEDMAFLTTLFALLADKGDTAGWQEIMQVISENPNLSYINHMRIKEWHAATAQIYSQVQDETRP